MWTEHTRWCSWNGTVHPVPMVTHGMPIPQGECLGPLTFCLWLSAGQRFVEQRLQVNLKSSIYMDDRSFVTKDAETLVEARSAWASWSTKVGLLESQQKIQMTAKSKRQKSSLQSLIPAEWFHQEVTMLGVVSRGGRRSNATTEEGRLAKAKKRLIVLAGLRLGSNLVAVYSRIFAISLCSYGWIARLPVQKDVESMWKLIKKGQKVLHSSNTWLRCMVHGGISHLSPICACNLFRVVAILRCRFQISWTNICGSPVAALRKWFTDHRFKEAAPWVWFHVDDESIRISAECYARPHLDRMRHLIREGWRFFCWDRFLHTSRHEISTAAHVSAAQLRAVDWAAVRSMSASCAASRTAEHFGQSFVETHLLQASPMPGCFMNHLGQGVEIKENSVATQLGFQEHRVCEVLQKDSMYDLSNTFKVLVIDKPLIGRFKPLSAAVHEPGSVGNLDDLLLHSPSIQGEFFDEVDRFRKTFVQVPGCENRTAERIREIVTEAVDKLSRQHKVTSASQVAQLEFKVSRQAYTALYSFIFPHLQSLLTEKEDQLQRSVRSYAALDDLLKAVPGGERLCFVDVTESAAELELLEGKIAPHEKIECVDKAHALLQKSIASRVAPETRSSAAPMEITGDDVPWCSLM
eukprot:s4850_g1.t1